MAEVVPRGKSLLSWKKMSKADIEVIFSEPFQRELKRLAKAYRHIRQDVLPLVTQLENGETPGDKLRNLVPYIVYKTRVKNSDAQRGKSGGYRVIYYVKTEETVMMLVIYSKSEQENIDPQRLLEIIRASEETE